MSISWWRHWPPMTSSRHIFKTQMVIGSWQHQAITSDHQPPLLLKLLVSPSRLNNWSTFRVQLQHSKAQSSVQTIRRFRLDLFRADLHDVLFATVNRHGKR